MILLVGTCLLFMASGALIAAYFTAQFYGRHIGRVLATARDTGILTETQVSEVVDLLDVVQ